MVRAPNRARAFEPRLKPILAAAQKERKHFGTFFNKWLLISGKVFLFSRTREKNKKRRRLFVAKTELVRNRPNRTFLKSQVSRFVQKFFQVLATFIEGQRMLERKRPALIFALQSFILVLHSMPGSFENNLLSTV